MSQQSVRGPGGPAHRANEGVRTATPGEAGRHAGRGATRRAPHLVPAAMLLVAVGGVLGAAAREAVEQALPSAAAAFPKATFAINLAGAFVLGLLLEALVRAGADTGWRRRTRLLAGTGFCGAFTTYSTFAVETVDLARAGHGGTAVAYALATVVGGLVAVALGIVAGAATWRAGAPVELPVDPDVETEGGR